ncbi:MAG: hypothetical protein HDQ88_10640 [Clostridia bacterium]|nr:hypothetical protein [Clostridia bacterium]
MTLAVLLILFGICMSAEAILIHVVILDSYPILYGMHFFFYGVALIFLIWGIVQIIRLLNCRKRRILRGQLQTELKIQSKSHPNKGKNSVKSSIYGGQLILTGANSKPVKNPVKSSIYGGQTKNKR